jgi:hypothetical protein
VDPFERQRLPLLRVERRYHRHVRVAWIAIALVVAASPARADVVSPPPEQCPAGSEGIDCHGRPTCRIRRCNENTDCGDGEACQRRNLCVTVQNCGGESGEPRYDHVTGECRDGSCAEGDCNRRASVCVPDPNRSGCGCITTGTPAKAPAGGLLLITIIAGLVIRDRASRAARRPPR